TQTRRCIPNIQILHGWWCEELSTSHLHVIHLPFRRALSFAFCSSPHRKDEGCLGQCLLNPFCVVKTPSAPPQWSFQLTSACVAGFWYVLLRIWVFAGLWPHHLFFLFRR
ncbi:hypothetical protein A2U01_0056152, partial [Trifolium medium]|nr:hypothetical protein [Trifolium medium]